MISTALALVLKRLLGYSTEWSKKGLVEEEENKYLAAALCSLKLRTGCNYYLRYWKYERCKTKFVTYFSSGFNMINFVKSIVF